MPQRRVRSTAVTADGDRDLIVTVLEGHRPQRHGRRFDLDGAPAAVRLDVDAMTVAERREREGPFMAWNGSNGDGGGAHGRSSLLLFDVLPVVVGRGGDVATARVTHRPILLIPCHREKPRMRKEGLTSPADALVT